MAKIIRDDIDKFFDYEIHVPSRTVYMGSVTHSISEGESGTDGAMAERVVKALHLLDRASKEPITIIMNNIGGDEVHGMAIYDAIKACKSHVTVQVFGHAMSMGSIIMQAADTRVMAPNAKMMIHYGTVSFSGHAKTVQKMDKEAEKYDKWMENMYLDKIHVKHPDFKLVKLKRMLDFDTFFWSQEAVDMGLCDMVLGEEDGQV